MSEILIRVRCSTHRSKIMKKLETARAAVRGVSVNRSATGTAGDVHINHKCNCTYVVDFADADLAEVFADRLASHLKGKVA